MRYKNESLIQILKQFVLFLIGPVAGFFTAGSFKEDHLFLDERVLIIIFNTSIINIC